MSAKYPWMTDDDEPRIQALEAEGLTRSDAQSVVEAENLKASRRRADLEAPFFQLQPQSQGKPEGVQGDLIGAAGLDRKPR